MNIRHRFANNPVLDEKQLFIASNRYTKLNSNGKSSKESVKDMFIRISKLIASAEKKYKTKPEDIAKLEDDFFDIQSNFKFISGMPLNDRGRNKLMPDCFVLPLEDSLEKIYQTLFESVQLHRLGAGIGYDFSLLRPEGSLVKSTGKEASGPISFMRLFDFSSEIILNRGSARHAGHMGILRIDHPDIEKFIEAKQDYSQLTNFNLSIAITDKFINACKKNTTFDLCYPDSKTIYKKIKARKLLRLIAESVHKSGEPGIIFIDEINRKNTLKNVAKITATNLCGEQPLLPYESCNLGSLVLSRFLIKNKEIDWKELERVTRLAVRFLDNSIDLTYFVLEKSREIVSNLHRKIGLGVMGFADMLAILGIPYDSIEARTLVEKIMRFIIKIGRDESSKLGKIKGNFKNFNKSIFPSLKFKYMRNATITTIAPNGTISLFADCNGGIEPFFALAYVRQNMETLNNKSFTYVNKLLEKDLKKNWLYSKDLMKKISSEGSIENIKDIPARMKKIYKTAHMIKPIDHLLMQASFQKFTDNAVSKTINISTNATVKDIENIYLNAYKFKLKGVTIYRDKSRDKQVLKV